MGRRVQLLEGVESAEVRVVHDWQDMDRLLLALRAAHQEIAAIDAYHGARIAKEQQAMAKASGPARARIKRMEEVGRGWAQAQKSALGDRRTVRLVHGEVQYRTGAPRLFSGRSDDELVGALIEAGEEGCVRTKRDPDRRAVAQLPPSRRERLGVEVRQEERVRLVPSSEPLPSYPDVAE